MSEDPAVPEDGGGGTNADNTSSLIRRLLSDSIYVWACGQKSDDEDDDIKLSDRLIGWLILFMQGFAYTMLIVLARNQSSSDTTSSSVDSDQSGYRLASVTGAMYLLVASTTHDLGAGYSLLVDGSCAGRRSFGIGVLVVYGIMITAAMTVIVSTSDDSASVVLNAVTVLSIADLDEKALKFLSTVPHKWRLFWALESIAISFALALVAILYTGNGSPLLKANKDILETFPTWFIWVLNPVAVTMSSVLWSYILQAVCEFFSETCARADNPTLSFVVVSTFDRLLAAIKKAMENVRVEPFLWFILAMWFAHGGVSLMYLRESRGFPVAFKLAPDTSASVHDSWVLTDKLMVLLVVNALLAIGVVMKAVAVLVSRYERVRVTPKRLISSEGDRPRNRWSTRGTPGVSSLLVGWGVGYWATSLLYVLGSSWHGSRWHNAATFVTIAGYVLLPGFAVACIFMVTDANVLGARLGAIIKPAVDRLGNRRTVEHWIMATVLRDVLMFWFMFCVSLKSLLNFW